MVIPSYYPKIGGAEKQLSILADELNKQGVLSKILTRRLPDTKKTQKINGTNVVRLFSKFYPIGFLISLIYFLFSERVNFTHIHVHTLNSPLIVCAVFGFFFNIPVIAKVTRTGIGSQIDTYQSTFVKRKLFTIINHMVSAFVAITRDVENSLIESKVKKSKIYRIGNGVDVKNKNSTNQAKKIRICYVGRLIERKRVDWVIKSIAELYHNDNIKDIELSIVGDGENKTELHKITSDLGLTDIVNFYGSVSQDMVSKILSEHSVFILPSNSEGLSNALLEAMSNALLVIATDIPANSELIESEVNGLLFNDLPELTACIKKYCLHKEKFDSFRQNAHRTIVNNFSISMIAQQYNFLYKEIENR